MATASTASFSVPVKSMREARLPIVPISLHAGHGGDLSAARLAYPQAPEPWLDLSTGVNPHAYPFGDLPGEGLTRLPDPAELHALESAAAKAYGIPAHGEAVAAPGSQAIINWLPHLFPARQAGILGFSYCEHAANWRSGGAQVSVEEDIAGLEDKDVGIIVNPNNPDGRLIPAQDLRELAAGLHRRGGLLIVDEAFVDFLEPRASLAPDLPPEGAIVLRSFGKTYGLPGLRLGFAIAARPVAEKLRAALGPWPVSGMAIAIARKALPDDGWRAAIRLRLMAEGAALDAILAAAGFIPLGGTLLYRLVRHKEAQGWFGRLAAGGILVRRFDARPDWLRFGIAGSEADRKRLCAALGLERTPNSR